MVEFFHAFGLVFIHHRNHFSPRNRDCSVSEWPNIMQLFGPEHPNRVQLFGHEHPNSLLHTHVCYPIMFVFLFHICLHMFGHDHPNIVNLFGPEHPNGASQFVRTWKTVHIGNPNSFPGEKNFTEVAKIRKNNIETDISIAALIERHHLIVLFFLHCTRKMEWKNLRTRRKDERDGRKWVG